jgi:hypothetical protein
LIRKKQDNFRRDSLTTTRGISGASEVYTPFDRESGLFRPTGSDPGGFPIIIIGYPFQLSVITYIFAVFKSFQNI